MKGIKNKELRKVKGGISVWGIVMAITAGIFTAGIFDGIARPFACRK